MAEDKNSINKADLVYTISLLLSLTRAEYKRDLNKMSIDTLSAMYREYIANAQSTNHMSDDLREAKQEISKLQLENSLLNRKVKSLVNKRGKR